MAYEAGMKKMGEVAGFGAEFEGFFVISLNGSLQLLKSTCRRRPILRKAVRRPAVVLGV